MSVVDDQSLRYSPPLIIDRRRSTGDGKVEVVGIVLPSTKRVVDFSCFTGGFPGSEFLEKMGYGVSTPNGDFFSVKIRARLIDELTSRV